MSNAIAFIKARAKAIAALVAPVLVALAAHYGFHVDVNTAEVAITAILAGVAVHQTPNKPAV